MFVQISGEAGYKAFQQIKQNFENLTQNFACQNPSSFLANSASLGKRIVACSKVSRGGIGCGWFVDPKMG